MIKIDKKNVYVVNLSHNADLLNRVYTHLYINGRYIKFGSRQYTKFYEHISKLCSKSAGQLNAICRIGHLIGLEERKILINSFIYANFNYCPLVWHFSSRKSINKIENIQKRALRFLLNDYSWLWNSFEEN